MKFFKKFDVTKVKALSFDLDDTLYDNHPVIKRAEEIFAVYLQNRYHLPPSFGTDSFWSAMKLAEGLRHPEFKEDVTKLDAQGMSGESAGGVSISYTSDYSPSVYASLNKHKRIKTIG